MAYKWRALKVYITEARLKLELELELELGLNLILGYKITQVMR
jgi:hypothetical protein